MNVPSNKILFLANEPNPDGPMDLSRAVVLANVDSIQVVNEPSVLDLSIDLNHNTEENEEGNQTISMV